MQKWLMLTWMESPDMNDLKFYIVYKDSTDDVIDFSKVCNDDYFLEKLIDDYLNGLNLLHLTLIPFQIQDNSNIYASFVFVIFTKDKSLKKI